MGGVCAKNEAGKVATDAPRRRTGDKDLQSSQAGLHRVQEKKFVTAEIDFTQNLPEGKSADDVARETATAWCE